jgi:hypothetical protein
MKNSVSLFLVVFLSTIICRAVYSYEFDPIEIEIINTPQSENRNDISLRLMYLKLKRDNILNLAKKHNDNKVFSSVNNFFDLFFDKTDDFYISVKETFNTVDENDIRAIGIKLVYFVKICCIVYGIDYSTGKYITDTDYRSSGQDIDDIWFTMGVLANYLFRINKLGQNKYFLDIINFAGDMRIGIERG